MRYAKEWEKEINRRMEEVRVGKVKTIPWSRVKRDLDQMLAQRRAKAQSQRSNV